MSKLFLNKYLLYVCFFVFIFIFFALYPSILFGQDQAELQQGLLNSYFCGERPELKAEPKDINDLKGKDFLEINWPSLGEEDLDTIVSGESISLSKIVNYFYSFSLWLAVVVGFVSVIIAGFTYISSGSNPEKRKEATDRSKNILLGTIILLSSVLMLNFVNPDLKDLDLCYETGDCRTDIDQAEEIELPRSRLGSVVYIKQDYLGEYSGISYTNLEGSKLFYENILYRSQSTACFDCDGEGIVGYDVVETQIVNKDNPSLLEPSCNFYCAETRDRIKDFLERDCYKNQGHNYSNLYQADGSNYVDFYIFVDGSEAAPPVNCTIACMAKSDDQGESCRGIEGGEAFYGWFDTEKDSYRNIINEGRIDLYRRQYKFDMPYSPHDSYLLDFFEDGNNDKIKDRRDFRVCIGEKYVVDSQYVEQVGGNVCLCKNQ